MDRFLLTPFSITVLNVGCLLLLLVHFLSRHREKSAATRSLLLFLGGVCLVFASFFVIFSTVDAVVATRAWWALHLFVFPAAAMVQFAYHFPENPFPEEARRLLPVCLLAGALVYPLYVRHTLALTPDFSFEGFLFVYLNTPEIGVLIGLEILWMLAVLYRKARSFEAERPGAPVGPLGLLRARDPRGRLIRNLMLIFTSPLVLLAALLLAYAGYLSWGLVAHILGTGLMVAAFLFAVLYINNCAEPSTFMLKLVGVSLGALLIAFGMGASIAVEVTEEGFDREHRLLIARALAAGEGADLPEGLAYLLEWRGAAGTGPGVARVRASGSLAEELSGAGFQPMGAGTGRGYRRLSPLNPELWFVTYRLDREGQRVEIGVPYLRYRRALHATCLRLLGVLLLTVVAVVALLPPFFRATLLRPLHALLDGVGEVNDGNLDARVPVRVRDEIGFLSDSFNRMVGSVQEAERRLQQSLDLQVRLTDAYSCFFPREFLDFLEKESVLEIGLGDNVQLEMTVLFSDIRSFTNLSEKMSPEENFRFINDYLGRVGPIVRDRGGFIDKYIGDAVMALFPGSPDDAVAAALGMHRAVREYNLELEAEGRPPIEIGIGIHTGSLMLGTIGEARRMEGTVISDAVNLASRLEGLTKMYGASTVISAATLERLSEPPPHGTRELDRVRVKGKQDSVGVIEVLDGMAPERTAARQTSREAFARGLEGFRAGDFEAALETFRELAASAPDDLAVALYVARCERYLAEGTPEGWDGVVALTSK